MRELLDILEQVVQDHASDLFIVAGGPICEKRDKRLIPITEEKVFPGETERLIEGI